MASHFCRWLFLGSRSYISSIAGRDFDPRRLYRR